MIGPLRHVFHAPIHTWMEYRQLELEGTFAFVAHCRALGFEPPKRNLLSFKEIDWDDLPAELQDRLTALGEEKPETGKVLQVTHPISKEQWQHGRARGLPVIAAAA